MKQEDIVRGFIQLGKLMTAVGEGREWSDYSLGITEEEYNNLERLVIRQKQLNGWFTEENVRLAMNALGRQLTATDIQNWISHYRYSSTPRRVGIIMAGNIPLVGFHDLLCVLISGHRAVIKLSSDDNTLLPELIKHLISFVSGLEDRVTISSGKIGELEAVIATGSDNSTLYFEQYFGRYPHIFRSNRTSVAVLNGEETAKDLKLLGNDIFQYFGLGCRNVSHLLLPEGFELHRIFEALFTFGEIIHHHKYANNYDYNRAVYLLNQVPFLDNHFVLLRESQELYSPLAVVHYHFYSSAEDIANYLNQHKNKIQAVVGKGYLPFGTTQCPGLTDYADGIDTMDFLTRL
ncbi:MAG: acyl-CoA reductase [Bacteroidota bacterium]